MLHNVELMNEIAAIRAKFLQRIAIWLPEIEALRDDLSVGLCSGVELQELQRRVHKVAGSAGSFGFPEFGGSATTLEHMLGDTIASKDRAMSVAALLPALNHFLFLAEQLETMPADKRLTPSAEPAPISLQTDQSLSSTAIVVPTTVRAPHVLIADDDELVRAYIAHGLASTGWWFSEAEDGTEVLSILQDLRSASASTMPDLIILDVDMPEMDGFTTLNRIKAVAKYQDIPVVILTSRDEDIAMVRGFAYGAVEYITKPIELQPLERILKSAMFRSRGG